MSFVKCERVRHLIMSEGDASLTSHCIGTAWEIGQLAVS